MNVVVLHGTLTRLPEERVLPSGDRLVTFEVRIQRPDLPAETVPVVWFDAPARALDHGEGAAVVVVGRVRRRFFRSGGTTASRTEVVADEVVGARRRQRIEAALGRARASLEGYDPLASAS
jgi:single-strand DNA-binding protein